MSSRKQPGLIGACLAIMASTVGCVEADRNHATTPAAFKPVTSAGTGADSASGDLCMFDGLHSGEQAVAAAPSLRQHTFATDGTDFDPGITPDGKRLVFSSTRHSQFSHLYTKIIDGAAITQITDGPTNEAQPTVSPDGHRIAHASDRAGNWDIWVVDFDGRNPMQLTHNPWPEMHPSWSPDGKQLVFCRVNPRDHEGELWIVELANPGTQRLIGNGLLPVWSPKGDRIAFQRARRRAGHLFSIWTIEFKDGEPLYPTEIVASPDSALIAPAWSPDGSRLAYTVVEPGEIPADRIGPMCGGPSRRCGINVVDLEGEGPQEVIASQGESYSPFWGQDGRIYFTVKCDKTETIWSVSPKVGPGAAEPADKLVDRGPGPIERVRESGHAAH